ncbi:MAG: Uma2 family endonuclease [Cyanobacteria bacterium P01_A01_bin.135]
MVALQDLSAWLEADDPEERQIISGVRWESYDVLLNSRDRLPHRITYLDGVLELVSPSRRHERRKSIIGSLLEDYFKEKRIPYFPLGSTTFRQQNQQGGVEPDESYCLGSEKALPDLAIEVVVTSGGIDKLEVYRRLQVSEVWFFKNDRFELYCLTPEGYQLVESSRLLPHLDIALLSQSVVAPDPLEAAIAFRSAIQKP